MRRGDQKQNDCRRMCAMLSRTHGVLIIALLALLVPCASCSKGRTLGIHFPKRRSYPNQGNLPYSHLGDRHFAELPCEPGLKS